MAVRCCGCPLRMMACVARAEASDTHGSGRPGHMGDVRMVYGTVDLWVCGAVAGHHRGPAPAECSVAAQACDCRMRSSPALMRPTLHPLPQRASPPGVVFAGGGGCWLGKLACRGFLDRRIAQCQCRLTSSAICPALPWVCMGYGRCACMRAAARQAADGARRRASFGEEAMGDDARRGRSASAVG